MADRPLRWVWYSFSVVVIGYGLALGRLAGRYDFLNSYPFLTADGFDWYYEGLVLYERILGHCTPPLWLLRNPVFVLVCTLDATLRANGLIVITAQTFAFFLTGAVLLHAARFYAAGFVLAAAIVTIMLLQPLNYVRLFVLADPLAVAFLTISGYVMLHYLRTPSVTTLTASGVFGLLGGLTQTYGAIPFLIGTAVGAAANARSANRRSGFLAPAVALVAFAACLATFNLAWRTAISHESEPIPFGFLKASFGMAPFYAHVWSFVYIPLLPLGVSALRSWFWTGRRFAREVLFLGITIIAFAVLSFFYQFGEARFTFIYQPIVLMLFMALASPDAQAAAPRPRRQWDLPSAASVCSAVSVAVSLAVAPLTYYGEPRLVRPRSSLAVQLWFARPVDRFGLDSFTSSGNYANARLVDVGPYAMLRPYPQQILSSYLALRRAQQERLTGGAPGGVDRSGGLMACKE
jgi:hypothetical protein